MRKTAVIAVCAVLFTPLLFGATQKRIAVRNWSVPSLKLASNGSISGRASFVAVDPCRIVDTRNANGPYGGPKLVGGTSRSFIVPGGPCAGIPVGAAYSLNLTVTQPEADNGFLKAYPTGSVQPLVASLNFNMNETKGNAAIVPADGTGSIDIFSNVTTHLIIDINGYFTEPVITGVTAGTGLSGGGTSGNVMLGINTSGATSGQALSYNGTTTTWSNVINGVTAGTGLSGGGTSGTVSLNVNFAGSGTANTAARSDHSHYVRTVIVNSGGSATVNGTALLNALAAITTASSTNQYLLKIEPGVYDVGTSSFQMKPFVDIEGSGELATKITRAGFNTFGNATVNGSDNAELRFLTVENTGTGGAYAFGIYNTSASPHISHVTVQSSGASTNNYGMYNDGSSPILDRLTMNVTGGFNASIGILISNNSSPVIHDTTVKSMTGGGTTTIVFGMYIVNNTTGAPIIQNSTAAASGGTSAVGVNTFSASGSLVEVVASGTGGTNNFGVRNQGTGTFTFTIDRSSLVGATNTISSTTGYTVMVGASKLDGGAVSAGGGTVTCIASYNGNYANAGGFTACP